MVYVRYYLVPCDLSPVGYEFAPLNVDILDVGGEGVICPVEAIQIGELTKNHVRYKGLNNEKDT